MADQLPDIHPSRLVSPLLQYTQYSEFKRILDRIATQLAQSQQKSVAVISELPGEGKTFFVSALALGYSTLLNKRVLIINTIDFAKSRALDLETLYKAPVRAIPSIAQPDRPQPNWRIIDIISPHTDEYPDSGESADFQIAQYIAAARGSYDLILADTCALSTTNRKNVDPVIIARHADTSILITSPSSKNKQTIQRTRARVDQWGIKVMGTVYNPGMTR